MRPTADYVEAGKQFFQNKGWEAFRFQTDAWSAYLRGYSGILNAPTGSGKTYALWIAVLLEYLREQEKVRPSKQAYKGLQFIWITPIKALSKEISLATTRACEEMNIPFTIGVRTGDTSTSDRAKMKRNPPNLLITTPESLHLMLASKDYPKLFGSLRLFVADEWHELIGSKRGVQVELALSRLKALRPKLRIWGISATIGNMDEAIQVLLGPELPKKHRFIKARIKKKVEVVSILPDEIEKFPWAGHLGIRMLPKLIPILRESNSTLIFTNTRAQAEIWYQRLLDAAPELAGIMAMHHGSVSRELRDWVENALHTGQLKVVVCTSSLDLGVDFRPVETVVQIGGPKGIARFMQRAGRSGHQPGAVSRIFFVPTHSLELVEAASLRQAIKDNTVEDRIPYLRSIDVLVQYLVTLAVSDGFHPEQIYKEVSNTFCFQGLTKDEFSWCLGFITNGGDSLQGYDEYHKVEVENGLFKVKSRRVAMRHRMSIGTIVSEVVMTVKFVTGGRIGTVEEWFVSRLKPGDVFWFAGRALELVRIKGTEVQVRKSKAKTGKIPSWQGGRMSLTSQMSEMLRTKLQESMEPRSRDVELRVIRPLVQLQAKRSHVPAKDEFLIEKIETKEGHHVFCYPFEGRFVHEGIAAVLAYRISLLQPITFSIAMNDYGFELLSDVEIPIEDAIDTNIFSTDHLLDDIQASINATEMARRRFRDIASIAGLVFQGFPGNYKGDKHLQSSSQLFFEVFRDYDADNLLLRQAYEEVNEFQLEEARMRKALQRINKQSLVLKYPERPTPFAFPIMVDRLSREKLTSEKLQDRIRKMSLQLDE